eukprot:scaffold2871_cov381-Prasinococcus_capsulatus_cf.AAC.6
MFIHRRLGNREPFQYVTATAHWLDLVLCVGPGVLCPRPETETLLEIAEKAILDKPHLREGPWADLGTGSGALAIALARTLSRHETSQDTVVYAVECSPQAAAYAHVNIERCAPRQVELVSGNWCSPFLGSDDTAAPQERLVGKLAGLVSNPPYIPKADLAELQREVGEHEPRLALDGGEGDGLDHLRSIFHGAREVLMPGGFIAVETNGQEQCEELLASLQASRDWQEAAIHADLGGVTRFVSAVRSSYFWGGIGWLRGQRGSRYARLRPSWPTSYGTTNAIHSPSARSSARSTPAGRNSRRCESLPHIQQLSEPVPFPPLQSPLSRPLLGQLAPLLLLCAPSDAQRYFQTAALVLLLRLYEHSSTGAAQPMRW